MSTPVGQQSSASTARPTTKRNHPTTNQPRPQDLGSLDLAEAPLRRALAIREACLGPTHLDTMRCLNNLAGLVEARVGGGAVQRGGTVPGEGTVQGARGTDGCRWIGFEQPDWPFGVEKCGGGRGGQGQGQAIEWA